MRKTFGVIIMAPPSLQLAWQIAPAALDRLYAGVLRVLETTGVRFDAEDAREVLRRRGVRLDGAVAHITPAQVAWALSVAPRAFDLYDRQGRKVITRGAAEQPLFAAGGGCTRVLDRRTGAIRPFTLADAEEAVRLTDALPQILDANSVGCIADVPPDRAEYHAFALRLRCSTKPFSLPARTRAGLRAMLDIVTREAGGPEALRRRPFCWTGTNATSPLMYSALACEIMLDAARAGLAVSGAGWPQMGATAPMAVPAAVLVACAESLAGLVLAQCAREGTPYYVTGSAPPFDMRALICATGAPERALGNALLIRLGRHVGLPANCSATATDAKSVGVQSGAERALQCLAAAAAGADIVGGLGWLDSCNVFSPEQLVFDADLADAVSRLLRTESFDDTALAVETIEQVGPGGQFLEADHTLARFKEEIWYPALWERAAGGAAREDDTTLRRRARERIEELLARPPPPPLAPATQQALAALLTG